MLSNIFHLNIPIQQFYVNNLKICSTTPFLLIQTKFIISPSVCLVFIPHIQNIVHCSFWIRKKVRSRPAHHMNDVNSIPYTSLIWKFIFSSSRAILLCWSLWVSCYCEEIEFVNSVFPHSKRLSNEKGHQKIFTKDIRLMIFVSGAVVCYSWGII